VTTGLKFQFDLQVCTSISIWPLANSINLRMQRLFTPIAMHSSVVDLAKVEIIIDHSFRDVSIEGVAQSH
jgi:hypothetical protein